MSSRLAGGLRARRAHTAGKAASEWKWSKADQLLRKRRIQGFDETGISAIMHTVPHFRGHTQEIIHITRTQLGPAYKIDFVPKGAEQISAGGV